MSTLIDKLVQKKVIIWGAGAIQTDIEALFPQINIANYVLNSETDKENITESVLIKTILPKQLEYESLDDIFIIICVQEMSFALKYMDLLRLDCNKHYITYERILYEYSIDQFRINFTNCFFVLWGIGKTFKDYYEYIEKESNGISYLIDSRCDMDIGINTYNLYTPSQGIANLNGEKIIVTSRYYSLIVDQLKEKNYLPGKHCLYVETYRALCEIEKKLNASYIFEKRHSDSSKLLIVLAGYKSILWDEVFHRIDKYKPKEYDVCILSSGLYSHDISIYCKKYSWSYLSTKENKISIIINLAIRLHKNAELIFKMDEDIFLTSDTLKKMEEVYYLFNIKERYEVGFVSPLIPVNTFGYVKILELLGKENEWLKEFGIIKYTNGLNHHKSILENPKAAEFLWGDHGDMGEYIDFLNDISANCKSQYSICSTRYSIGLVMFLRETWLDMGMFPDKGNNNMGADEECLNEYCLMSGKVMLIAENAVVGHLGYKDQTKDMILNYQKRKLQEDY
ncbi:MAG: hypothetical protein KIC73_14330 [Clostridiales bacterium]|nr:hypothetical protein [Clostridiales bacterium]